jgi:metal-dependent HD superfamily phosphatase/phosphodiesterase
VIHFLLLQLLGFDSHRLHNVLSVVVEQATLVWILSELFLQQLKAFYVCSNLEKTFDCDDQQQRPLSVSAKDTYSFSFVSVMSVQNISNFSAVSTVF